MGRTGALFRIQGIELLETGGTYDVFGGTGQQSGLSTRTSKHYLVDPPT
jgi:hypothetical protein